MTVVISVEELSKTYRLGQIGTGTFASDLKLWWAKLRGKPNPLLRIGETDPGNRDGETIWALKDVSFTVNQGEVLGIIGRNGAGKSTLLKILSRVTAPTSGRIRVRGRVASLLEVGTGFHPELTGRENVYLNGALLGMSHREVTRKFDEIVDFSGVEKFIDTPVKRYSSGMHVRLGFAVAAHLEPEILVVDEVLAVGDAEFQKKCLGKMGDVARGGRTVLFVSHNMTAIQALCTRSVVLMQGQCQFDGETMQAIQRYLNFELGKGEVFFDSCTLRSGNGLAQFTHARFLTSGSIPTGICQMGSGITLELEFSCKSKLRSPVFGVVLRTPFNQNIIRWGTKETYGIMPYTSNGGRVRLHIKNLDLLPGVYTIALGISDMDEQCDLIENALQLEITPRNIYPTGKLPPMGTAIVFTECTWDFEYE